MKTAQLICFFLLTLAASCEPEPVYADAVTLPNLNKSATGTSLGGGHYGLDINGTVTATNPSVGTNTSVAPISSTEIGIIDGSGNLQGVSSSNPVPVTGTVTATNPAIGTTGASAPGSATYFGANKAGNLVAPLLDASGNLQSVISEAIPAGTNSIGGVTQAGSAGVANAPVYNVYSSTNITTSSYVQLVASTTSAANYLDIFDSSGQAMILATGGSGSEVILSYVPPGGDQIRVQIPAGTRVAYKALTGNAASGYLLVNLWK